LKSFLSKVLAVHVEQNHWQIVSVSTPLPFYTITVSPWISHILKFSSIYKLLLDFLSRQSLPVFFAICINLVHLDCQMPSASLWNKHTISHLCPKFVVISLSASFCSSTSKLIFSKGTLRFLSYLLLSILATISAVCVTKLSVRMSLHFVVLSPSVRHFCNTGPLSLSSMLSISPVTILRPLSPLHTAKYKGNYRMYLPRIQVRILVFCSIRLIVEI
jgi:hypothetical protein